MPKTTSVTKAVSPIKNKSSKTSFQSNKKLIREFLNEGEHKIEQVEIKLEAHSPYRFGTLGEHHPLKLDKKTLKSLSDSFGLSISEQDILSIFGRIVAVLQDPHTVAKHLKPLDAKIGEVIRPLNYTDEDLPQYLIPARGYFIPGPPPENYEVRNQGRSLDAELLNREIASGINASGVRKTPKFVGFIPHTNANKFVGKDAHLFSEDVQVDNLLLHSKYAHRLHFEIIRNAVAAEDLDLSIGTAGRKLSQPELLELMTTVKKPTNFLEYLLGSSTNLWEYLVDSLDESLIPARINTKKQSSSDAEWSLHDLHNSCYSPSNFSYSSRSPFTLNSLITCFGKELELPNLQHYLLNSHWKEAAQMVGRAREIIQEARSSKLEMLGNFFARPFSDPSHYKEAPAINTEFSSLYTHCMKSLASIGFINPAIIDSSPLTKSPQQAEESTKYRIYPNPQDQSSGIKIKITQAKTLGNTNKSFDQYIPEKSAQTAKENPPKPEPEKFSFSNLFSTNRKVSPTISTNNQQR